MGLERRDNKGEIKRICKREKYKAVAGKDGGVRSATLFIDGLKP